MAIQLNSSTTPAMPRTVLYRSCLLGILPAEVLDTPEFERLIRDLWEADWTDVQIAAHTRTSTYTTGRIRERLGLAAHQDLKEATA